MKESPKGQRDCQRRVLQWPEFLNLGAPLIARFIQMYYQPMMKKRKKNRRSMKRMRNHLALRRCQQSQGRPCLVFLDLRHLPRQLLWIRKILPDPHKIGLRRLWERSRHRVAVKLLQASPKKVNKSPQQPRKRFQAAKSLNHVQVRPHQVRNLLSKIVSRNPWLLMLISTKNLKYLARVRSKVKRKSLELVLI